LFLHRLESLVARWERVLRLTFLTVGNAVISVQMFSITLRVFFHDFQRRRRYKLDTVFLQMFILIEEREGDWLQLFVSSFILPTTHTHTLIQTLIPS
jgi:hypothetical protein